MTFEISTMTDECLVSRNSLRKIPVGQVCVVSNVDKQLEIQTMQQEKLPGWPGFVLSNVDKQ